MGDLAVFLVSAETICSWTGRLEEEGPDALVQTAQPVNKYDDAVCAMVKRLHAAAPEKGRRKLAELLARAGLILADSTVRRMLNKSKPAPSAPPPAEPEPSESGGEEKPPAPGVDDEPDRPPRVVTAKRPHHLWHVDITTTAIGLPTAGLWAPWWPFCLLLRWLWCWHIALVLDHYSRALLAFRIMRREPTAADICALLEAALARATMAPAHIISDQGTQFRDEFRAWCKRRGAKPRRWLPTASDRPAPRSGSSATPLALSWGRGVGPSAGRRGHRISPAAGAETIAAARRGP